MNVSKNKYFWYSNFEFGKTLRLIYLGYSASKPKLEKTMSSRLQSALPLKIFTSSQKIWFITLLIAQLSFVVYLSAGYGLTSLSEGLSAWTDFNDTAYVSGDTLGNSMYAVHVLLAIVMMMGGSLQLIPALRNRFRTFHRYNGRVFVLLACTISIAGMYLIISRGTVGNTLLHALTGFSGVMVIVASFFAIKAARSKRFDLHQRWALHLFLAANGVLFFRLFLFAWLMIFGTLGINTENFTGPTVLCISVLSYLIPHVLVQALWYVNKHRQSWSLISISSTLLLISASFAVGLLGLVVGNWYPNVIA